MRVIRKVCLDRTMDGADGNEAVSALQDLSSGDGKLQAAVRLVLLYLESPPESWREPSE